jgi:2'-5' RNA ligase
MRRAVTTQEDHADRRTKAPECNVHDGFWPHVSVAYSNTVQPTTTVRSKIEILRSLPPAEVPVTHLTLVELTRDGSAYRWEEVDRVAVGG